MKVKILLALATTFMFACTTVEKNTDESVVLIEELEVSEFDFSCEEDLIKWTGGLQDIATTDSTCCFPMAYCMQDEEDSYEVIWKPKGEQFIALNNSKKMDTLKQLSDADFLLLSFSIDEEEVEEPQDEFDLYRYQFPFLSEVRVLFNNEWYFVDEREINNAQEFSLYKKEYLYKQYQ